jgi:hypothetical protein
MKEPADCVKDMLASKEFQEALRASKGVNATDMRVAYLVLNHETLKWSAYHWVPTASAGYVTKEDEATISGPDGNPRIMRSGGEKLVLVVMRANPFLYSYEGTVSPPQDSPDAAALKSALSAIGSAIAAISQVRITLAPPVNLKEQEQALQDLKTLVKTRERVHRFVQALETGDDITQVPSPNEVTDAARKGRAALDIIETLAQPLPLRSCYQTWSPLLRLADLPSIENEDLAAARADMVKTSALGDIECGEVVKKAFLVLQKLRDASDPKERPKLLVKILAEDEAALDARKALSLDKALSAKKDFLLAAAQLDAFVRLGRAQALGLETGDSLTWPLSKRVAVVVPPFPDQVWLQDNPGTISIKSETSVCPECTRLKPTGVDKKFLLVSQRQAFLGVGFGITFTSIKDPTFGAVYADEDTQVIARTSEESRSGTIVAMAYLRARALFNRTAQPRCLEPGLELGAGLDSKKPGLYAGVSFEIHRFVRLGFGGTWQVVNRLADGLTAAIYDANGQPVAGTGTIVFGAGDVRTRKAVKSGLYLGLIFALDGLPLFSPSK